uniref:TonB-dependent receptor n=1 Tax=uncultured Sphingomonas sp. TaxID=158754 RepID=UPI0035CAF7E5
MRRFVIAAILTIAPTLATAQDKTAAELGSADIIVTASRREADGFDASQPAIGLRRRADFAIQELTITGDTRDEAKRHGEMFDMLRGALAQAARDGVQLATGDTVVEPLTAGNYRALTLKKDSRPDAEKLTFLVKAPLGPGSEAKAALDRIDAFVKAVPTVGRALMEKSDDLTLSIVAPDQYRPQIVQAVADDARAMATRFGPDYAVEAKGIERPVEWTRAGLTDVLLYIPYQLTVVPKR